MEPPVTIAIESNGKSALAHAEEALLWSSFYRMGSTIHARDTAFRVLKVCHRDGREFDLLHYQKGLVLAILYLVP